MMEEAADHLDAARAKQCQPPVAPGKIEQARPFGRHALPQDRVAYRLDAERCDQVDIGIARAMAGLVALVAPALVEPHDRAFGTAPQLQGSLRGRLSHVNLLD